MQLHFRNQYGPRIWIAILYHEPACQGDWERACWWSVDAGQSVHVVNTNNRYAYYYADAADGAQWTGPFGPYRYPNRAWRLCLGLGQIPTPENLLGLREVDISADNYTVNLVA